MRKQEVTLNVNGNSHEVYMAPNISLLDTLRDKLYYYDVKSGCETGNCGACTVLMDGQPVNSCLVLTAQAEGHEIVTVMGLGTEEKPHLLQDAYSDLGAAQCGFCIPGMIIASAALLEENPSPTRDEIRKYLSGNICRCTGYQKAVDAVEFVAQQMAEVA